MGQDVFSTFSIAFGRRTVLVRPSLLSRKVDKAQNDAQNDLATAKGREHPLNRPRLTWPTIRVRGPQRAPSTFRPVGNLARKHWHTDIATKRISAKPRHSMDLFDTAIERRDFDDSCCHIDIVTVVTDVQLSREYDIFFRHSSTMQNKSIC